MNNTPISVKPTTLYAIFYPIKYLLYSTVLLAASYFAKPYLTPYVSPEILKYIVGGIMTITLLAYILSYLTIKSATYTITDEQIIYKRGIFTITTDYIELYRVIDFTEIRTFLLRLIGGMTFVMDTTDKSHPTFTLTGIPRSDIDTEIRARVEENRKNKRVIVTE